MQPAVVSSAGFTFDTTVPAYTFESLSHHDFELLVRDLLQVELDLRLETFAAGRDEGIDLRYTTSRDQPSLVIQAKHFARSTFSTLKSRLRSELPKIERLAPERYILATSVPLTVRRKRELLTLLEPYVTSAQDIKGQEDLNNLLSIHREVEKAHFKLWLTSVPVLQTVLRHDIYSRSLQLRESLKHKLRLYVPNRSFSIAEDILAKHHVCVIAGVPGIGKSMLAEMLLVAHIARGFEPVLVSEDISEASAVLSNSPQVFYYDDFLGQTSSLDKLGKNEDSRLLAFMSQVRESTNKRLVLTTREYILTQATFRYERLARLDAFERLVINLEDYTRFARAKILYNHLYFSSLPANALEGVVAKRFYREIIGHRNYNPRLIEAVTTLAGDEATTGSRFAAFFLSTLDNPERIWRHAYENQIGLEAQTVMLALTAMPNQVRVAGLFEAFVSLHPERTSSEGSMSNFKPALRTLEGNFLTLEKVDGEQVVSFHNPSIRDFMLSQLESDIEEFGVLLRAAVHFDHVHRLSRYNSEMVDDSHGTEVGLRYPAIARFVQDHQLDVINAMDRTFEHDLAGVHLLDTGDRWRSRRIVAAAHMPREQRLLAMVEFEEEIDDSQAAEVVERRLAEVLQSWKGGSGGKEASADLVVWLQQSSRWRPMLERHHDLLRQWFVEDLAGADDYEAAKRVIDLDLGLLDREEVEEITDGFRAWAADEAAFSIDAAENTAGLDSELDRLYSIADLYDINLEDVIDWDQYQRKKRILEEDEWEPDEDDWRERGTVGSSDDAVIDALFDSLGERD